MGCVLLNAWQADSPWNQMLESVELAFTIAFTVELLLWAIACGVMTTEGTPGRMVIAYFKTFPHGLRRLAWFLSLVLVTWYNKFAPRSLRLPVAPPPPPIHVQLKPAYLSIRWNLLDFVVVLTSWPSLYAGTGSTMSVLRLLRLLKPLRTVKMMPGMQLLVEVCFGIAENQAWVFLLTAFVCLYAANPLMLLWSETLDGRCVAVDVNVSLPLEERAQAAAVTNAGLAFERLCTLHPDGLPGRSCPVNFTCADSDTMPSFDQRGFDSIGVALLTLIQVLTLDDWTKILYQLWDGNHGLVIVPMVPLTVMGAYTLLSISLTVVVVQVSRRLQGQEKGRKNQAHIEELRKASRRERFLSITQTGRTSSGKRLGAFALASLEVSKYIEDTREQLEEAAKLYPLKGPPLAKQYDWGGLRWSLFCFISAPRAPLTAAEARALVLPPEVEERRHQISRFDTAMLALIVANGALLGVQYHGMPQSTIDVLDSVRRCRARFPTLTPFLRVLGPLLASRVCR